MRYGRAMLEVTRSITLQDWELVEVFTRASGPGGQHVNTSDTAVQLRFHVRNSPSLPDGVKERLIELGGSRVTADGELILSASGHRSQERNRQEARERLVELIRVAATPRKRRRPTKPTRSSQRKRVDEKKQRGQIKQMRKTPLD